MRWTQTLIPTQKETPADATLASHRLMLRAGMIRQLQAGAYDFLPLGLRSLQKAQKIVREEMDAAGAAEVLLPALQPINLWKQSGRNEAYGDDLLRVQDRHGRWSVLGPTHEEVVTELVRAYVGSYKQLPLTLYQIQTKFRDEPRPRSGLLRVREFLMKDAYSFHADAKSLDDTYQVLFAAYSNIFRRCGIPFETVEAESGPIGGSGSHEFTVVCDAGEDFIAVSDMGNYAANVEKADTGPRPHTFAGPPTGELETVHTPGASSIEAVGKAMKVKPKNLLKTLVFRVEHSDSTGGDAAGDAAKVGFLLAVVRGDHEVNQPKLQAAARIAGLIAQAATLVLPPEEELKPRFPVGFVGPGLLRTDPAVGAVVDPDAAQAQFWAAGANEAEHHVKHFNWFRDAGDALADPARVAVADVRNAAEGDPSPRNDGGVLTIKRGIELGHVFKLGTRYSDAMDLQIVTESGGRTPVLMGCYGIGIGRILIAAAEVFHDDRGLAWPAALAPFSVCITPIKYEGNVKAACDKLYLALSAAGLDPILDDRPDARAGAKFADADLIGFPLRLTVGDRGLADGNVELKQRTAPDPEQVPLADVVDRARALLSA